MDVCPCPTSMLQKTAPEPLSQLGERSKRVDAGGCGYSGDRDATRMDVAGTSTTKLFGRECEGEGRDAGYREDQDGPSDDRGIPEADVDASAGASGGHSCDALGGSTDRPDQTARELIRAGDECGGPPFDLGVANGLLLKALGRNELVEKGARILQNNAAHLCLAP
jgi:hypothetical protein